MQQITFTRPVVIEGMGTITAGSSMSFDNATAANFVTKGVAIYTNATTSVPQQYIQTFANITAAQAAAPTTFGLYATLTGCLLFYSTALHTIYNPAVNAKTGSYTPTLEDDHGLITVTSASPATITINSVANWLPGSQLMVQNNGTSTVTFGFLGATNLQNNQAIPNGQVLIATLIGGNSWSVAILNSSQLYDSLGNPLYDSLNSPLLVTG